MTTPRTVLSWPYRRTDCQYTRRLYDHLTRIEAGVEVADYRPGRFWKRAPDVMHLHWPETAVDHPNYPRALLRGAVVLADLVSMKMRGTTVVWTRHDDGSHRQTHPRTERFFVKLYERLTDGFVFLTEGSRRHMRASDDATEPSTVIPHGVGPVGTVTQQDRRAARAELGLADLPTIGIVGRLQRYKNVVETIDAFAAVGRGQLIVAGLPVGEGYAEQLAQRQATPGLSMRLDRLTDEEFTRHIRACDVVVLPYTGHLNSGVAFEALAAPNRVAVTRSPSTVELVDLAGHEWVRLIEAPPRPETIATVLDWASEPAPASFSLRANWDEVAADNWRFFVSLR